MVDGVSFNRSPETLVITAPDGPLTLKVDQDKPIVNEMPPEVQSGGGTPQLPVLDPPKAMSMEDMMLALQALQTKIQDQQATTSKNDIQNTLNQKTAENDERIKQLEESISKMADAKKAGVFGKVFGWIATIAALVISAALIATGVGVVAGSMMLAGAVLGLGMQIFNEAGGMEAMAKACGENGAQAFMWTMMAVQILLAVGSLGAGLASSSATVASKLPTLAGILGKTMGGFAQAGSSVNALANMTKVVAGVISGLSMVGQGASGIAGGVYSKDASDASAKAKETEAEMLKLQALMEEEMKRLKKILDEMEEGASIAMQALSSANETKSTITQKLGV